MIILFKPGSGRRSKVLFFLTSPDQRGDFEPVFGKRELFLLAFCYYSNQGGNGFLNFYSMIFCPISGSLSIQIREPNWS
jgi:hypothetical protein